MRARPLTALHTALHGLPVPATVIAEVGYFLAREALPAWSRCPAVSGWWGLRARRLDQH